MSIKKTPKEIFDFFKGYKYITMDKNKLVSVHKSKPTLEEDWGEWHSSTNLCFGNNVKTDWGELRGWRNRIIKKEREE